MIFMIKNLDDIISKQTFQIIYFVMRGISILNFMTLEILYQKVFGIFEVEKAW